MTDHRRYAGIDCFRVVAAILVIAIHISPLADIQETGDFILTRVIARVAVPFFFMTTGFFLISQYSRSTEKLTAFVKKTLFLYGAAIFLYLPLNLYNHYFQMEYLLPNLIKDFIFDGTFYHLWYLPASIIGALLAWYLVKRFRYPGALTIATVLYAIGLFGDSYYGVAERISSFQTLDRVFRSVITREMGFFLPRSFLFLAVF